MSGESHRSFDVKDTSGASHRIAVLEDPSKLTMIGALHAVDGSSSSPLALTSASGELRLVYPGADGVLRELAAGPEFTLIDTRGVSHAVTPVREAGSYGLRSSLYERRTAASEIGDPEMVGAAASADFDPIQWIEIDAPGGYRIKTTAEPLSVGGVRLPMSFGDLIKVAAAHNAMPLTKTISDARWQQAVDKRITSPVQSKDGAHHNDAAQNATFAAQLGPVGHVLRDGGWKEMIIDPAQPLTKSGPNSMVFYGWRKPDGSTAQKGISSHHDREWIEYDSFGSLVSRDATLNGQPVDLLDVIAKGGPLGGPLAPWLVAELRGGDAVPSAIPLASIPGLSEWSTA